MPALWYFADPMCSWCWGFAPVMAAIAGQYHDRLDVRLIMGGLRPGTTSPIDPELRAEILHHWHEVQRRTGQPFRFEGAMPEGFIYDTEPASRAVIVVARWQRALALPYLHAVQHAFYAEQKDVTQAMTLTRLAEQQGMPAALFQEHFASDAARALAQSHFRQTRAAGIHGFPAVVLQHDEQQLLLTAGYRPLGELRPEIDDWFANVGN